MLRVWKALSRLGVDARLSPFEARHVELANQIGVLTIVLNLLALTNPAVWRVTYLPLILAVTALGHLVMISLNAAGLHFSARFFLGTWSIVTTDVGACFVPGAHGSLILLAIAAGVWLVPPRRDLPMAAAFCVLALASFAALESGLVPSFGHAVVDADTLQSLTRLNVFAVFFLLVGMGVHAAVNAARADAVIQAERDKSRALLLNVLPAPIADRLLERADTIADRFDSATVLFADLASFTTLAERTPATELVKKLDEIFSAFDALAERHQLEKIKTLGDAYMVAGGVPQPRPDHAHAVARMALEMFGALEKLPGASGLSLRIGIATGPIVAGVIGRKKFTYDMWGDTVNTASRMESHGRVGHIHCTHEVFTALSGEFEFESRGSIEVKGKGPLQTYFLLGPKRA